MSLLWLLAAAVAMAVSTEFRRSVGDLRERVGRDTCRRAESDLRSGDWRLPRGGRYGAYSLTILAAQRVTLIGQAPIV